MLNFEQLRAVNAEVNRVPYMKEFNEDWRPATTDFMGMLNGADCDSSATAKLQKLYRAGWPIEVLRLMVCNHPADAPKPKGNHLCLLVDLDGETYVLCNTLPEPTLMDRVPYQWLEVQDHKSPTGWAYA